MYTATYDVYILTWSIMYSHLQENIGCLQYCVPSYPQLCITLCFVCIDGGIFWAFYCTLWSYRRWVRSICGYYVLVYMCVILSALMNYWWELLCTTHFALWHLSVEDSMSFSIMGYVCASGGGNKFYLVGQIYISRHRGNGGVVCCNVLRLESSVT